MRALARPGLLVLSALAVSAAPFDSARAQAPAPAAKAADPAAAPVRAAILIQVLATANGETITRGELIHFLSNYQISETDRSMVYKDAIETLINTHLINQYLASQKIAVPEEKVDQAIDTLKKQLAQNGNDLASEILRTGISMADVRKEFASRIRWIEFLNANATDDELKKFAASHKDLFNGTQVKASHILLKVEPNSTPAQKEAVRQKLVALKQEIESGKTTFTAAANKHSEDPGNESGAGGDVGYFSLNSGFVEEFANPAFALKKGQLSDVVETPYGYHLILVTDRKEGTPLDFEQNKPLVKQLYAADLQKKVLQRVQEAKIDIKPMPADLFTAGPAPTAAPPTSGATPKPAAPK